MQNKHKLENRKQTEYGLQYHEHLLEQWKICVEMANHTSDRRVNNNNLFITINAAIIALFSFTYESKNFLLLILGIIICILWYLTINNYKMLNHVKYQIIVEMEKKLPVSPYSFEWMILRKENKGMLFTHLERILPSIFIFIYLITCIIIIVKWRTN